MKNCCCRQTLLASVMRPSIYCADIGKVQQIAASKFFSAMTMANGAHSTSQGLSPESICLAQRMHLVRARKAVSQKVNASPAKLEAEIESVLIS